MKTPICLAIVIQLLILPVSLVAAGPRDKLWKEVGDAMEKGLPKTAIEKLEPIIKGAMKEQAWPEAIKAVAARAAYESEIEGAKPEERITRLEAELAKAPPEMRPVLEAILAEWYWQYFQGNRSQFLKRTRTGEAAGKDFTTWDLPRLFAVIGAHFTKALAAEAELKKVAVADFGALLAKGTVPDAYRPTLYDFLAHEALAFYTSGEQAGAKAQDEFELMADGPVFGTTDDFLKWEPAGEAITVQAIRLFQNLLRTRAGDADKTALLHCDLERLRFGKNRATGEERDARYVAALKRFAEQWADHEVSAWARFDWASQLAAETPAEAHAIARQGAAAFPKSIGGTLCHNLLRQIEAKTLSIQTERVWNAPWPAISMRYRNFTALHFRLVRLDWAKELRQAERDDDLDERLAGMKPERAWKVALPATPDFRERTEEVTVPQDLPPGFYALLASPKADFGKEDNVVSSTQVWVSDLALVLRTRGNDSKVGGFVLDARSGEPIEGAEVRLWTEGDNGFSAGWVTTKTDGNGQFSKAGKRDSSVLVEVRWKGQQLVSEDALSLGSRESDRDAESQTVFFTDRSLYRPGQTIHYKGICLHADRDRNNYKVLGGQAVTVAFLDVNRKEIAKSTHKTNDYGSFSGSFTAPRDRLAGQMTITVQKGPDGATQFNVEEYKRPNFHVTLDAPKDAAKLGGKVSVGGKAEAYTGAAIGGAKVRWRVVRAVRLPDWWGVCFWWRKAPESAAQEIAHGTAETKDDGSFAVEFVAKPDRAVAENDEPTFSYIVHADVTDTTGETRTAERGVQVGYAALRVVLSAEDWQVADKVVELKIEAASLDGEGRAAEGVLKIHRLKQPEQVARPSLEDDPDRGVHRVADGAPKPDPARPDSWELGEVAAERAFKADGTGKTTVAAQLKPGPYRALLEAKDQFGKKVTAQHRFNVLNLDGQPLAIRVPSIVVAPKWEVEPGAEFMALWGTGYGQARAFIEVEHRGKMVQKFWTEPGVCQQQVKVAVTEALRGGFTLHATMVRENRAYLTSEHVEVPWSNKALKVKWEHFTSKLEPAQKEKWTAVITGPEAKKTAAEMVATLYDQSLDAFKPHAWQEAFSVFTQDDSSLQMQFENSMEELGTLHGNWRIEGSAIEIRYRRFPDEIAKRDWAGGGGGVAKAVMSIEMAASSPAPPRSGNGRYLGGFADMPAKPKADGDTTKRMAPALTALAGVFSEPQFQVVIRGRGALPAPDLSTISTRKNLNETAFFFPQLLAREDGSVAMEFTMPEALTTWRFMGFAHDRELRSGFIEAKVVTSKDIMVQPNPPRFLREGDALEFTVKVSNQSATRQTGKVRLAFADARTGKPALVDAAGDQDFDLPSHEARSFSWKLKVPDGAEPLSYKAVGSTGRLSDGEEGLLPVLSRRTLVTESLPLPVRGAQTKHFAFKRLLESGKSDTLKSQSLTVQMVSNPSWYAVLALPYLMEFPHECSEQTFNRLYANALARHIAASDPKIRAVFDQWKATPALASPLEKNADIKTVMLEETPWVRQAQAESQARRDVGVLFDSNRLDDETARLLRQLAEQQLGNGAWPWFPGGPACDYITLYITTGFGRLRHLGVKIDTAAAVHSLARLDAWIEKEYREIKPKDRDGRHLTSTIALYLYGRSFFLTEKPIARNHREAVDYFLAQARKHWLTLGHRQSQAHAAIALKRFGDKPAAQAILKSLRERSVSNEEMGMFWRDNERSWSWQRAPIETQALMIEAFDEVMNDTEAVENCKVWLLKQKQAQDWRTTKATADAIYALLLRGENVLASDALVELTLGGEAIKPEKVEAGTGFYEQKFVRGEVKPELGKITLKKTDKGVSWGSVHWQYLEDMAKITAHEDTPLKVTKTLFTRQHTKNGPVLEPVKGPVKVGGELVVRIVVRVDRDMEYVHLKDHRGSGTEPVNVLSQFKFQDGLGYYETTRDTASHFFFEHLPKGDYVFEYTTRIVHRGRYQTGFASIECMYAPEFGGHSESLWVEAE